MGENKHGIWGLVAEKWWKKYANLKLFHSNTRTLDVLSLWICLFLSIPFANVIEASIISYYIFAIDPNSSFIPSFCSQKNIVYTLPVKRSPKIHL